MKNLLAALALLAPFIFGSIAFAYNIEEGLETEKPKEEKVTSQAISGSNLETHNLDLTAPGQFIHINKAIQAAETSNSQIDSSNIAAGSNHNLELGASPALDKDDVLMSSLTEDNMIESVNSIEINSNSIMESGNNTENATDDSASITTVETANTLETTTTAYESDRTESTDGSFEPDNTAEPAVDTESRQAEEAVTTVEETEEPQPTQEEDQFGVEDLTHNEIDLLARLVRAEAQTEPLEGKIAVACVVLNRVKSSQFPDTIKGVIYQPRQFQPVANNQINKPADAESIEAVQAALTDHHHIAEDSLFFYNPDIATSRWLDSRETTVVIGQHVFKK